MVRRVVIAMAMVVIGAGAPFAPASAQTCSYQVSIYTKVGAFLPENPTSLSGVAGPGVHSGAFGCQLSSLGVETDTFYIYPGSTMASARLMATVSAAVHGCVDSPEGGLLEQTWCGTWELTETLPGVYHASSRHLPIDPTRSGALVAWADDHGSSNVYRTIDR